MEIYEKDNVMRFFTKLKEELQVLNTKLKEDIQALKDFSNIKSKLEVG